MKTEPTEAGDMLYKFAEMREWNKNKLIGWSEAADFADWFANQSSPKIKQLEWKEYENFRGRKSYFAKTPFSPYEVADGGDHYTMFSPDKRLRFASADEAKAAAQADFENRIKEYLL
ncbi:hypothetical protein [Petrimonas sp.]|uniref:hypothetical protein n=1 Tax=Petrimonas sp. TaxID=2023866 RepID=UPI002FC98073